MLVITPKVAGNLLLFGASIRINTTLSIGKVDYIGKHSYTCVEEWLLLIRLTNMLVHVHSSVRVTNGWVSWLICHANETFASEMRL